MIGTLVLANNATVSLLGPGAIYATTYVSGTGTATKKNGAKIYNLH